MRRLNDRFRRGAFVLVIGVLWVGVPMALHGCNTVEGAGQDIEEVGEEISD